MSIQKLIIEDVRCFAGRKEFNICPITFLVGENSTGKSTALGCLQTLHSFAGIGGYGSELDFNVEPYQMGAFADIVRRSNPRKKSFTLGLKFGAGSERKTVEYLLTLAGKEKGSEPIVQEQKIVFPKGGIIFDDNNQENDLSDESIDTRRNITITNIPGKDKNRMFVVKQRIPYLGRSAFRILDYVFFIMDKEKETLSSQEKEFRRFMENYRSVLRSLFRDMPFFQGTYSFAPICSKPRRTYDPLREDVSPEGGDIPMVLMNTSRADKEKWEELRDRLIEFGKASGLFTDITVRRLGKSMGDPFQLQIKVKGPKVNLIDVGYGVNQILPILVRIFNESKRTTFLMQQPEVHLHPRGQAELSSLFAALARQRGHNFVIETHSDAMISRTRIEIMNKRIAPEDVSLIYLEPSGNSVEVHNIRFDEQANLLDAPSGYRDFFLNESDKLLGFIKG